jgi:hypothetical protein
MNVYQLLKTAASLTTGFHRDFYFFFRISRYSVRTRNDTCLYPRVRTVSLFGKTSGRFPT